MTNPIPREGQFQAASELSVLIVARNFAKGAGGMENTAAKLANHLSATGTRVGLAFEASDLESIYSLHPEIEAIPIPRPSFKDKSPYDAAIADRVYDVIVYFYSQYREIAPLVGLLEHGVPVVLHEGSNPGRIVEKWAEQRGVDRSQADLERIAALSLCTRVRFTLEDYRSSLPDELFPDSVAFPNAFPRPSDDELNLPRHTTRKRFINVGGLKAVKNLIAAVEAFALISEKAPNWDFHVFSAGPEDSPIRKAVLAIASKSGLLDRILLFPPTNALGSEFARSDVHVIASKQEGLPNCVAEAARYGVPSIGFACCPGTNSMIVDGRSGLLVDCGDEEIERFGEAMLWMAQHDSERAAMGTAAYDDAAQYDPEIVNSKWEALLTDAANDSRSESELFFDRYGNSNFGNKLRQVQKATLGASAWTQPVTRLIETPSMVSLSLVVPIFNKELYLAETLESLASSDTREAEVILVDDSSSDSSNEIARRFADRFGWKLVCHESNQGLSAARNSGLRHATGEIIQFWDADDVYDSTGSNEVVRRMIRAGTDIGMGLASRNGKVLDHYQAVAFNSDCVTYAKRPDLLGPASSCFKLYRREFLVDNELHFVPSLYMQDSEFNLRAFPLAEGITVTDCILGEYRLVHNSGARTFHPGRFESALRIDELTEAFYNRFGLAALDRFRQLHILEFVWPNFVYRATTDHSVIGKSTNSADLDFEYLGKLSERLCKFGPAIDLLKESDPTLGEVYEALSIGDLVGAFFLVSNRRAIRQRAS